MGSGMMLRRGRSGRMRRMIWRWMGRWISGLARG
jgi:hypothetical protein